MIQRATAGLGFPKSARLLKSKDFQFRPYKRIVTDNFTLVFTSRGSGRLGVSISKKVLRRAVARNRVRRLIRESFRLDAGLFADIDLHVVGRSALTLNWRNLKRETIRKEMQELSKS